ncbi:MAG: glycoside hydrolase family 3 C-terminal domain-containing protein [Balneolaceae bacterium]|nr:glycoside hydrolase family 3 C-terminal domain-containing protein [Balneolaceae bacterium]
MCGNTAIMDVLTGNYTPQVKLPFSLANSAEAVIKQAQDLPGYPEEYTLYPFGYGLSY